MLPLYHIFGSEELSLLSPGVAQLSPQPYVAMNSADAAQAGFEPQSNVEFTIAGTSYRLPLQLRDDLPQGVAGLPAGIGILQGVQLPAWSKIVRTL